MTPQDLIQEVGTLFALPDAALRLMALLDDPEVTTQELTEVIQVDSGLSAAVLRMANSAYYGLPTRVGRLDTAINLVGQRALRTLVLSVSVTQAFKGLPAALIDMRSFWANSTVCGTLARALARHCRLAQADDLFLAGLLHATGRLVFYARRPVHYREILKPELSAWQLAAEERRLFGFDHAALGAALLQQWRLPPLLVSVIEHQLSPLEAVPFEQEAAVLHLAQALAEDISPHLKRPPASPDALPVFESKVLDRLNLALTDLPIIRELALREAAELQAIIDPSAGRGAPRA